MRRETHENRTPAKIALYNVSEDYARVMEKRTENQPPQNAQFTDGYYIVAVGERLPPEPEPVYITADGKETTLPTKAQPFDTYADALKWMVENCEITQFDGVIIPRGYERPRYPRVCYLRVYNDVTEL